MNYYWLISNCSSFFCFRLSLLFAFILSFSLLYLSLCVCLIASLFPSSIPLILVIIFVFFFWCSCILFFCSHDAVCLFLCIFQYSLFEYSVLFLLVEVMLSGCIVIFRSSPTNNTSV